MTKLKKLKNFSTIIGVLILLAIFSIACGSEYLTENGDDESRSGDVELDSGTTAHEDQVDQAEAEPSETSVEIGENEESETENSLDSSEQNIVQVDGSNGLKIDSSSTETDAFGLTVGFTEDGHPFRGDPAAPIVLKEYSDYQCPFCSRFFNETLPALEENQIAAGEVVLVFYDFPLNNIHPQASLAANAARCAGEQGATAYWAMHDALFRNPDEWSNRDPVDALNSYAEDFGLNMETFEACVANDTYGDQVQADLDSGAALGVSGTPSFFINDQILVGAQPIAAFEDAISTVKQGGQLASNEPQQPPPSQPAMAPTPAAFQDEYAGMLGDPDAPVTIVEFTDYQCPYCAQHSMETLPLIILEMIASGRVQYYLKDLPLDSLHPNARVAAAAARCAGEQDDYWGMHDVLFRYQSSWAISTASAADMFGDYATELELNQDSFVACLESGRFEAAVEANAAEARSLGIGGTPHFFVDGYPLNGARPIEHFQLAVQYAEEGRLAEAYAPPEEPQAPSGPADIPTGESFNIGDPDAPVTIIEYTDYQCPFCSRHFEETYPQILEQYVDVGLVNYVFKDFPLNSIHPQASRAAEAARCAADQDAFQTMHDMLFARQNDWSGGNPDERFVGFAEELGLDTETFSQCLANGEHTAAVDADLNEGINLGVTGTPAFFINGYPLSGAQPFAVFEQAIESFLTE